MVAVHVITKGSGRMSQDANSNTNAYKHTVEAVQRPDVGVEAQFSNKKKPKI